MTTSRVGKLAIEPAILADLIGIEAGHEIAGATVDPQGKILLYIVGPSMPELLPEVSTTPRDNREERVQHVHLHYHAQEETKSACVVRALTCSWGFGGGNKWAYPWASIRVVQ